MLLLLAAHTCRLTLVLADHAHRIGLMLILRCTLLFLRLYTHLEHFQLLPPFNLFLAQRKLVGLGRGIRSHLLLFDLNLLGLDLKFLLLHLDERVLRLLCGLLLLSLGHIFLKQFCSCLSSQLGQLNLDLRW